MPRRNLIHDMAVGLTAFVLAMALRLWAASWRKDSSELRRLDEVLENGEYAIVAFWHGKYFPMFSLVEGYKALILTGKSFRGDVIARICRQFGFIPFPIGPGRHELRAFESELGEKRQLVALALDGPLGPFHKVKPGAVRIASDYGYRVVPMDVVSRPKWTTEKRWDRREFPLPFASVRLRVGDPIDIPSNLTAGEIETWQGRLLVRMEALNDGTDASHTAPQSRQT